MNRAPRRSPGATRLRRGPRRRRPRRSPPSGRRRTWLSSRPAGHPPRATSRSRSTGGYRGSPIGDRMARRPAPASRRRQHGTIHTCRARRIPGRPAGRSSAAVLPPGSGWADRACRRPAGSARSWCRRRRGAARTDPRARSAPRLGPARTTASRTTRRRPRGSWGQGGRPPVVAPSGRARRRTWRSRDPPRGFPADDDGHAGRAARTSARRRRRRATRGDPPPPRHRGAGSQASGPSR